MFTSTEVLSSALFTMLIIQNVYHYSKNSDYKVLIDCYPIVWLRKHFVGVNGSSHLFFLLFN